MALLIQSKQLAGFGTPIETGEIIPQPEGQLAGTQGTNALTNTYFGASFRLHRAAALGKILLSLTAATAGAQVRALIYQGSQGGSGTASKIASVSSAVLGAGAQDLTLSFSEGTISFAPGLIYILVGRAVAVAATLRVFTQSAFQLMNTNVNANTHPTAFTTALLASAADAATINPLVTLVASSTDVVPICRLIA